MTFISEHPALLELLRESQRRGFLGAGALDAAVDHATGFATATGSIPNRAADLGSGGGLPGLVLALVWPSSHWSLIDSQARRCGFLREAVQALDLTGRVHILHRRAESIGREATHRASYDLVVARGFGPPPVVAECAAPLLRVGGALVVSDPPGGDPRRWPADGLVVLGLEPEESLTAGASYQRLRQVSLCIDRYPRRAGIPAKRPLFR